MNQTKSRKIGCTLGRFATAAAVGALLLWAVTPASAQTPPGCFGTGVSIILTPSNLPNLLHGDTIEYEIRLQVNAPACNMINTDVFFFPPNVPPNAANACNANNGTLVAVVPLIEQGGAQILITSPTNPNAGSADFTHPALAYVVNHADEDANGVVTAFVCARGTQLTSPSQITTASTSIPNAVSHACCLPDGSCVTVTNAECLAQGGSIQATDVCTAEEACCLPDGTCANMDPLCCELAGGTPEGPGTACTEVQGCCLPDGTCVMLDPLCCEDIGGTPEGPGTACTSVQGCCLPDGTCVDMDPLCCEDLGGTPEGPGTVCTAAEACCLPDGTCVELDPLCCEDIGGTPEGAGTVCTETQACCLPDGTCVEMDPLCCEDQGGQPGGPGTVCSAEEACCLPDGTCISTDPVCCELAGGTPEGPGSVCSEPQACCLPDGTCVELDPLCCEDAGGTPEGPGTVCTETQACCLPDGTCVEMDPLCCEDQGGQPGGPGSVCTAEEACCLPDNTCIVTDPVCCTLAGGTPEGPGTLCTEIQACCLPDGSCADMDPLCCEDLGGLPQGAGVLCDSNPCGGGEGCTPGYWKQPQHFGNWTPPYTPSTQFSAVFEDAFPGKTLLQVLSTGGGGLNALGRHTVAALLNAASADVDYGMTAQQVIDAFNAVYPGTKADYEALKNELAGLNERECPLGRAPLNGD